MWTPKIYQIRQGPKSRLEVGNVHKWLRMTGFVMGFLGILGVIAAVTTTVMTLILFAILLLFAGCLQIFYHFIGGFPVFDLRLVTPLLYVGLGILILAEPLGSAIGITLIAALFFLVNGAMRIIVGIAAFRLGLNARYYLGGGIVSFLVAIFILAGWPGTGTWVIGLFIGIELLIGGATLVFYGTESKSGRSGHSR